MNEIELKAFRDARKTRLIQVALWGLLLVVASLFSYYRHSTTYHEAMEDIRSGKVTAEQYFEERGDHDDS